MKNDLNNDYSLTDLKMNNEPAWINLEDEREGVEEMLFSKKLIESFEWNEYETWIDDDGSFRIEAKFDGLKPDIITKLKYSLGNDEDRESILKSREWCY